MKAKWLSVAQVASWINPKMKSSHLLKYLKMHGYVDLQNMPTNAGFSEGVLRLRSASKTGKRMSAETASQQILLSTAFLGDEQREYISNAYEGLIAWYEDVVCKLD